MAKKPKKVVNEQEEDIGGFPQHGDPAPGMEDNIDDEPAGGNDPGDENDVEEDDDKTVNLQKQLEDQQREIENLKRQIPPAQPKPEDKSKKPTEPDWENLLYKDPKTAMELHRKMVKDEVTQEIRNEYQREKGTEKFWNDFYEKHKDLKPDHDLVNVTLNSNLDTLANIPVAEAMDKLADLTRGRIMRYAGNKAPGKKVRVEGSDPPTPRRQEVPSDKPSTLADIIKARKAKRRATAA